VLCFALQGCLDDDLTEAQQQHCSTFWAAQGLESGAIFFALIAWFLGVCVPKDGIRFSPSMGSILTASSAIGVIGTLNDSYMFRDREDVAFFTHIYLRSCFFVANLARRFAGQFSCSNVFGARLCHGYGAALHLQSIAVVACLMRVFFECLLVCLLYIYNPCHMCILIIRIFCF